MHIRLPHWTHRAGMTAIEEPTCPSGGRSAVGLATLGVAQGLLTGSVLIAQTLGTLEARRISDSVPVAGAALAAQLIGAAVSLMLVSRPVEHHMPRNGVLRTGFCLCAVGLATGGVAVAMRWLAPLILGSAIFGAGASLALLLRTVALEGRRPSDRGRTVGTVALGGAVGAVLGPGLLGLAAVLPTSLARPAPWWIASGACAAMGFILNRRLGHLPVRRGPAVVGGHTDTRAVVSATLTCAAASVVMIMTMASVTLQLHHLGTSDVVVTSALAAHYAAMYGFAVPFGILADGLGRRTSLVVGALLLAAAAAGLATDPAHYWLLTAVLICVGAGWSATFVTGSAALADAAGSGRRLAVTARSDLIVALTSGSAALGGTALLSAEGVRGVGTLAFGTSMVAIVAGAVLPRRSSS